MAFVGCLFGVDFLFIHVWFEISLCKVVFVILSGGLSLRVIQG